MFINSDVFLSKILSRIDGGVNIREPTTKGTFVQALFLVLFYIIADVVISLGYI